MNWISLGLGIDLRVRGCSRENMKKNYLKG